MNKRRLFVFLSVGVFFVFALRDLAIETKHDFFLFKNLQGLDNEQKRSFLLGDLYVLVKQCRQKIPENASALVISDSANDALYLAYHLSPRKLFFKEREDVRMTPPDIRKLDFEWIKKKNISWIILSFKIEHSVRSIVQVPK